MINLPLTIRELKNLIEWLDNYSDCGPQGQRWDSQELIDMRNKLNSLKEAIYD